MTPSVLEPPVARGTPSLDGSTRPERVVLAGSLPPPVNGQSVAFADLVQYVGPHRCRVVDLTSSSDAPSLLLHIFGYARTLVKFWRAIREGRPTVYLTIAQSRRGFLRDMAMIWLAWVKGNSIVVHLHGGNYDGFVEGQPAWLRWLIRMTLHRVSRIAVLSERLRGMFAFSPSLLNRLTVVPNGVSPPSPDSGDPKTLPASTEPLRLLYLSNLILSKGYLDVVRAAGILHHRYQINLHCVLAGRFCASPDDPRTVMTKPAKAEFEAVVRHNRLEGIVSYVGVVSGKAKEALLRQSHFFLLPTRYVNEGQPISIIEAMAYGNVVISTNFRAIPDLVLNNTTGSFVPFGSPEAIAERIYEIIRCPAQYEAMSLAAREHYARHFTLERHLQSLSVAIGL
jgi:glycosyltransferase involved in cell wall biosynthesis